METVPCQLPASGYRQRDWLPQLPESYRRPVDPRHFGRAAAGKYIVRLLPEYYLRGVVPAYLYELLDLRRKPLDAESNVGILRANGTPKPAYTSVKNLNALLSDPGPPFKPRVLRWTVSDHEKCCTSGQLLPF